MKSLRLLSFTLGLCLSSCATIASQDDATSDRTAWTRYACPDRTIVDARYPTTDRAEVSRNGRLIPMTIQRSASGARYTGGGWEWWTKGSREGTLAPLAPGEHIASSTGITCIAS